MYEYITTEAGKLLPRWLGHLNQLTVGIWNRKRESRIQDREISRFGISLLTISIPWINVYGRRGEATCLQVFSTLLNLNGQFGYFDSYAIRKGIAQFQICN